MNYKKKNTSFTLIELLVVIVIIGVLAGVIMVTTSSSVNNATLARAKAFSSNVQNSMLLNLVSEWNFDEPEKVGRITKDSWGVSDGTVTDATYKTTSDSVCVSGGCYSFLSGNYISIGNIQIPNSVSISVWGKTNRNVQQMIYGQKNGTFLYFPVSNNGKVRACFDGTSTDNPESGYVSDDKWHFIVFTNENSTAKIYIDGAIHSSWTESVISTPISLSIGKYGVDSTYPYVGLVDDMRLYNAALSSSQIKQNYIVGLNSLLANGNISKEDYNQRIEALGSR